MLNISLTLTGIVLFKYWTSISWLNKTQVKQFTFLNTTHTSTLNPLKTAWRKSLIIPQDGMWEAFMENANHWTIKEADQTIGYACMDGDNRLLQFFVLPIWLPNGIAVFQQFIRQEKITTGMVGTNNPVYHSIAMHFQKSVNIDSYLFTDFLSAESIQKMGALRLAEKDDLEKLIDFCHISVGAPKEWLKEYVGDLITKQEIFVLENGEDILGTCEVRKNKNQPTVADVGVIVSPDHRKKGIGTYLLGKAKEIAFQWNKTPICSTEKDNKGSLKAIQKNGFRSVHQILLMKF